MERAFWCVQYLWRVHLTWNLDKEKPQYSTKCLSTLTNVSCSDDWSSEYDSQSYDNIREKFQCMKQLWCQNKWNTARVLAKSDMNQQECSWTTVYTASLLDESRDDIQYFLLMSNTVINHTAILVSRCSAFSFLSWQRLTGVYKRPIAFLYSFPGSGLPKDNGLSHKKVYGMNVSSINSALWLSVRSLGSFIETVQRQSGRNFSSTEITKPWWISLFGSSQSTLEKARLICCLTHWTYK